MGEHLCSMRADRVLADKPRKYIFFDFECSQDKVGQCEAGYEPRKKVRCKQCEEKKKTCSQCKRCRNCNEITCGKQIHEANFVVAQKCCDSCKDSPINVKCNQCGNRCSQCNKYDRNEQTFVKQPCDTCGQREVVFEGDNVAEEFGEWLFNIQHVDCTVLSHNGKAYDNVFLLEYLLENSVRPAKIIYSGSKIMYMEIGKGLNIRVLDSLNFLPMKLASLPKAFDLTELKKGYFPHFFNTSDHQQYVGPYPDPKFYGADYMGTKDRKEFMTWHGEQQGRTFNFRQEMLDYCRSDVDILRQACCKFRQLVTEVTGEQVETEQDGEVITKWQNHIEPFDYITIAAVCLGIYKTKFLEETHRVTLINNLYNTTTPWCLGKRKGGKWEVCVQGQWLNEEELARDHLRVGSHTFVDTPIGQIPSGGYVQQDHYSKISIQWLSWLMHTQHIHIQHALNGGEVKVPGTRYRLDGYAEVDGKKMCYEFLGCVFHGCKTCYPDNRHEIKHPRTKHNMNELYALTIQKKVDLEKLGYTYQGIWEHEFRNQLKQNTDMSNYINSLDIQDRLKMKDSFFGGRTGASHLRYKAKEGEQIKYIDFTSLYPSINKQATYPVGHPLIISDNFKSIHNYFGIAKVTILPPRGLFHPVLPYRSGGKLKFSLCRTCADTENPNECKCSDEQRTMTGTWCTPEIQHAVDQGYKILTIHEVYHWEETTTYDSNRGKGGLFSDYVNTFLKLKQEASGWPDWCKTETDRQKYISDYHDHEGIRLDYDHIRKNPGLRSLAKLCLNSFWGKLGQKLVMKQTEFLHDTQADLFFQRVSDPTRKLEDFHIINEHLIELEYTHTNEFIPENFQTNVVLASFTTCWARLKLLAALEKIGNRVLYYDTDSIIYISRPGEYDPPLGDYLGEFTDELDGDYIIEFLSGGPKNYCYITYSKKEVTKVRGFTLNYINSQLVNFESMKKIIENEDQHIMTRNQKICRDKRKRKLYNREEEKKYQKVFTKRRVLSDYSTVPFGY